MAETWSKVLFCGFGLGLPRFGFKVQVLSGRRVLGYVVAVVGGGVAFCVEKLTDDDIHRYWGCRQAGRQTGRPACTSPVKKMAGGVGVGVVGGAGGCRYWLPEGLVLLLAVVAK